MKYLIKLILAIAIASTLGDFALADDFGDGDNESSAPSLQSNNFSDQGANLEAMPNRAAETETANVVEVRDELRQMEATSKQGVRLEQNDANEKAKIAAFTKKVAERAKNAKKVSTRAPASKHKSAAKKKIAKKKRTKKKVAKKTTKKHHRRGRDV
jgi:fibronectin type 3 domain-containing protein